MDIKNATSVVILGRQPAIGLAELESLYGDAVQPVGATPHNPKNFTAATLALKPTAIDFARLGGSIKAGRLFTRLNSTQWPAIEKYLRQTLPHQLQTMPEGKCKLGLSAYGFALTPAKLNATGLTLKKVIRSSGRSVRVVPNKTTELNSAQVLHNQLTGPTGCEILIIHDGDATLIAQTTAVQDIGAYAARDQGRPKRDARVGMLPPKLAQTIINLASGPANPADHTLLDPFCGTGVVLQEAALMGFGIYGTDLEPRMIDFTAKNLDWLAEQHHLPLSPALEAGDATTHHWQPGLASTIIVAAETYLGQPFSGVPTHEKLAEVRTTCNTIVRKFLQNIGTQIPAGTRLCLAVPAWQTAPGRFIHVPLLGPTPINSGKSLDHLGELGYNRISFKHVEPADLVYARADQIVARELLVVSKR